MGSNNLRDILFYKIRDHMEENDFYVINADFIGRPLIDIKNKFPNRFIQAGIAEQNMIAIACGLALEGKRPVTFSPNPFEYLRSYDQVRNGICAMNLPVTIVANGMGFVNPGLGVTHFTTEDYQLFSLCPGLKMITFSDEAVANAAAKLLIDGVDSPIYIRIDFDCDGFLPALENVNFSKGYRYLQKGNDTLIITQGYASRTALNLHIENQPAVIDVFSRPFDYRNLFLEMERYANVIVLEEQQRRGGFGSELLELCNANGKDAKFKIYAVEYGERFPENFGSRQYWMDKYSVGEQSIKRALFEQEG